MSTKQANVRTVLGAVPAQELGGDLDALYIGQWVKVVFKQSGDEQKPGAHVSCFILI